MKQNNEFYIYWYKEKSFIYYMVNMILRLGNSNKDNLKLENNYEKIFAIRYFIFKLS